MSGIKIKQLLRRLAISNLLTIWPGSEVAAMSVVLVFTSEPSIDQLCWQALSRVGHEVVSAKTVPEAIRASLAVRVSAVIIDAYVGDDDLETAAAWFRNNHGDQAGMIFLISAKARPGSLPVDPESDQIVVKPCSPDRIREAVERCAAARRQAPPDRLLTGGLELSRSDHTVRNKFGAVILTRREFQLIEYLAANRGRFVPSTELAEKIWCKPPGGEYSSIVSTSVKNLRAKIQPLCNSEELIQTFPRRGYLLNV